MTISHLNDITDRMEISECSHFLCLCQKQWFYDCETVKVAIKTYQINGMRAQEHFIYKYRHEDTAALS